MKLSKKEEKKIYEKTAEEQPYCQLCGKTYNLHIHHIYYRSQLGITVPKNLIRLCIECHNMVHSNKKYWQPKLLDIQYDKYGYFTKEEVIRCKNNG